MSPTTRIRQATREDVPEILAMIKELADFEKSPERVLATETSLHNTLTFAPCASDPSPKTAYARTFLLTVSDSENSASPSETTGAGVEKVAGFALFFNNYSTWLGCPGVYLEDLFVRPAFRRKGFATLLLKALAEETRRVSNGKGRLEWNCLRWNEGALKFYEGLGGERLDEWVGIRVEGERLKKLAER